MKKGGKKIAIAGGGFLGSELAWAIARTEPKVKNEIIQIVPESGMVFADALSWRRAHLR